MTAFEKLAQAAVQASAALHHEDKPTRDEVHAIVETVFFASLAREEGRPLTLRVAFLAPEGPHRPTVQSRGWWTIPFAEPLPFDKYELVKLAPAVDARQSFIAVTRCDGGLAIWGLINHGASTRYLVEGKTIHATSAGPAYLCVEASAPGVLDLLVGSTWSRRLVEGQVEPAPAPCFRAVGPLGDLIERGAADAQVTPGLWTRTLRLLLGEIQAARHGGTLLLHPTRADGHWNTEGLHLKRQVRDESLVLSEACRAASADEELFNCDLVRANQAFAQPYPPLTQEDAKRMVEARSRDALGEWLDAVRWVAALAAIDGALLLSWSFGVRAFGVIVTSVDKVEVTHAHSSDERDWKAFPWDRFGTRHQSAAAYCDAHRDSAAIVVSQDGVISLFRYQNGGVVMWRPCEVLDAGM
ncbi:MAG: hypothetical protein R3B48_02215 [Kofleriaceae bacterium]